MFFYSNAGCVITRTTAEIAIMPKVAFRQIRSRGIFLDQRAFRREVERTIDQKSKPELIQAHKRVVSNWRNEPEFKARKRIERKGISVFVYASGENARIWGYVTGGTRKHKIPLRPKPPGTALRFNWGGKGSYKPKTAPVGKFGGPGRVVGGKATFAKQVQHPGTKARNFEKTIADDYKKTFNRDIENAMRRGLRRARGK